MLKAAKYFLMVFVAFFIFTACKKYPENRLWFKSPENAFKGGRLEYLKVNGVDSLPYFNSYFGIDIPNEFISYDHDGNDLASFHFKGKLEIRRKSDIVGFYLRISGVTNLANSNQFTLTNFAEWQILKYTRQGELKLKTEKNGKTYEILFN